MSERTIDLSHVTIDSFAKGIGNEPEKVFAFVRDTVAYEPYTGCLRGSRGTLLALAGNSLDRAVLLKALLERNGFQTRLMRGELGVTEKKQLCEMPIANKLAGASEKLSGDAPVWPTDPGGPVPENAPPGDRGVIPLEYPPDESNIGGEPVRFLLGSLNPNTSLY
jgi:hypothetical protein